MTATSDSAGLRDGLVAALRSRGVIRSETIAAAFSAVAREQFIPDVLAAQGLEGVYRDRAFPIEHDSHGRPLSSSSQPAMMAEMLELLDVRPGHRVLEVGAGTGYNAALLSQLVGAAGTVTTIDVDPRFARRARRALQEGGYRVEVQSGDGRLGFAGGGPYDRIIVTACADELHRAWFEQLRDGGRIVVPLRLDPDADAIQLIPVLERRGRRLRSLETTWGGFMPLHGGDGGWRAPVASLNASRHRVQRQSSYVSISGAPVARLSETASQRLLAAALGRPVTVTRGWSSAGRGHTPLVLIYLLTEIPTARRVWVGQGDWHGIGMIDRSGRGLAVVLVRSVWQSDPKSARTRSRWRLHSYGEAGASRHELEQLLGRWRTLEREGEQRLEILAIPAGETMRARLRWR